MTGLNTSLIHIYRTDFATLTLMPAFVEEADARWPDRRCTRNPRWSRRVEKAMTALTRANYLGETNIGVLDSLQALEPYGLPA
jgi:hypothetical protein